MMAICIPFSIAWMIPNYLKDFGQSLVATSFFLSNILFWIESGYFETTSELKPLLHTWSLAIEEQYYILFPIFMLLAWRLGIKYIFLILLIIFITSFSLAAWGSLNKPSASYYLLPTRGWEILIGVFISIFLRHRGYFKSYLVNEVFSILGIVFILYAIFYFNNATPFPGYFALLPTLGAGLVILTAVPNTIVNRILSFNTFVFFGLISYSTYLWHQPILALARHKSYNDLSDFIILILCLFAILIGWLSWNFVEKPFRDKKKISKRLIFNLSIFGIIILSCIGQYINSIDGGLKYLPEDQKIVFSRFVNPTEYVIKRHSQIRLHQFDKTNNKKDILIIGDSFSEDLVNAVYEAKLDDLYEFSSFYISVECGVLFVAKTSYIKNHSTKCKNMNFTNIHLLKLITLADEVWIASSWYEKDLQYMNESLENISNINKNFVVFGTKYFGKVSPSWYKNIGMWKKKLDNKTVNEENLSSLNNAIKKVVNELNGTFIDSQKIICKKYIECSNYADGDLISYDGSHLTPHGAKIFGNNLKDAIYGSN